MSSKDSFLKTCLLEAEDNQQTSARPRTQRSGRGLHHGRATDHRRTLTHEVGFHTSAIAVEALETRASDPLTAGAAMETAVADGESGEKAFTRSESLGRPLMKVRRYSL